MQCNWFFRNQMKTVFYSNCCSLTTIATKYWKLSDAEKCFIKWHHIEICKKTFHIRWRWITLPISLYINGSSNIATLMIALLGVIAARVRFYERGWLCSNTFSMPFGWNIYLPSFLQSSEMYFVLNRNGYSFEFIERKTKNLHL